MLELEPTINDLPQLIEACLNELPEIDQDVIHNILGHIGRRTVRLRHRLKRPSTEDCKFGAVDPLHEATEHALVRLRIQLEKRGVAGLHDIRGG